MKHYYSKRHKGIFKYFQNKQTKYGYRFNYYDDNHKRHEKSKRGFSNIHDAINALGKLKSIKGTNKGNDLTIKDWCLHYINMIKPPIRKISTYKSYKILLTDNVIPTIGKYKIKKIDLDTYQTKCLNYLIKKGLSRNTVVEVNARVQTIMNYAVKTQIIKLNQLRLASVPNKNVKPRREIMSREQLHKFNQNLKHHSLLLQVIYFTLEFSGMRIGELLGMRFGSLNLNDNVITIDRTRDAYGIRSPKTPSSRRKIQIPDNLAKLLRKYVIYCKKHFKVNSHTLFILGKHGKPLVPHVIPVKLKQLLIECGLNELCGRFTPHEMRHQFASHLINIGVSPITVAQVLGHHSPDITLKYYSNSVPNNIPNINKLLKK